MSIQTENTPTSKIDLASIAAIGFFILYIAAGLYGAIS